MRKLASIEVIDKLEPIPNADKILKATIKGWECVVAKIDNFKVGDKVIYIEVDSVLPAKPEFDFMKERKYRVRTIKLRKQISQGLVLPMSYLKKDYPLGTDVTNELGITKSPLNPTLCETLIIVTSLSIASANFNADSPVDDAIKICLMFSATSNLSLTAEISSSV